MTSVAKRAQGKALQAASRVPWPVARPLAAVAALVLALRPNRQVRQWQLNIATLTGTEPGFSLTFRGLMSWARNLVESMHLGHLSAEKLDQIAVLSAEDRERLLGHAADPGAVIGLPHSGSWDLAGAWACSVGMPVSTVAEQLLDDQFALFLKIRQDLGFTVYGHRDITVADKLVKDSEAGKLVCLMSDRDFTRRGVPVVWNTATGPVEAKMPPGPARTALRAGASLMGIACHYSGRQMELVVSDIIEPPAGAETEAEKIATMTQELCDFFAAEIRKHPQDWHMMQPFFPGIKA